MPRGGKRPGAGRPKGAATKRTQELVNLALAEGVTPLEVMMTTMRAAWSEGNAEKAFEYAVHAAPYVHARLASTNMTVDDKRTPEQFTDAELEAFAAASGHGTAETSEGSSRPH